MALNPKRRTLRVSYGLFLSIYRTEGRWATRDELNRRVADMLGDVRISDRSYRHFRDYVKEGITMETFPALNRWEIARSATPGEFLDPS